MAEPYSNFVTPPDFVKDQHPNVLIVDADWIHIDSIALWCKTADVSLNIYIYQDIMLDEPWLMQVINSTDVIIMNPASSAIDHIKRHLIKNPKCWYYGDKTFLGNDRKLETPLDYFVRTYG